MSSEMFGGGIIAAAVLAPPAIFAGVVVGTAVGAGWLALQAGKLAISAAEGVNEEVRRKQFQLQEAEKQRKTAALAGHKQLVDMCQGVLTQLGSTHSGDLAELETMRRELRKICQETLPEDPARIESLTARGLMALERIVARQSQLKSLQLGSTGEYAGYALSDLMEDLRVAVSSAQITQTTGTNVTAADPKALERAALHRRLTDVSARIMDALDFVVDLEHNYGLSSANQAWFQSCFAGVDETIARLCAPRTSNEEMKKGIRSLEENMKLYDMFFPTLRAEKLSLDRLYPVYREAAAALGEKVHSLRHFRSAEALKEELLRLETRAKRAAECAAIYQALGPAGYMCYAWDQELAAMGYSVCSRKKITQMVTQKPDHARVEGGKLPFYQWKDEDLTQIYEIAPQCRMQLIVHPDGTITMETISEPTDKAALVALQKEHCKRMAAVCQKLRENWFILQDLQETDSPESIRTLYSWQDPAKNPWVHTEQDEEEFSDDRGAQTRTPHQQHMHNE